MRIDLDLTELNTWLEQFLHFGRRSNWEEIGLKTIETLSDKFGRPEGSCPCFHVGGSKGKGTIAASIAAILRAEGYKTGVYASPHVSHYVERVGTGVGPFPMAIYDKAFRELKVGVEELLAAGELIKDNIAWPELSTMFAMLCFREAAVDYAIYEVGMGGRLDATNIVLPECVAFGAIELEHTELLGKTLDAIAKEKAGIIKMGRPAVSVSQKPEVKTILTERAKEMQVQIDFLPQNKEYQLADAEVALAAVRRALPGVDQQRARKALAGVRLPGRFECLRNIEVLPDLPYLLIDVAHTPDSIKAVTTRIKKEGLGGKLLFGCVADKNVEEMARLLAENGSFSEIYLTRPGDFKKSDLIKMEQAFRREFADVETEIKINADFENFIPEVLRLANAEKVPLIVLGSFYLAGEVKKGLEKMRCA